MPQTNYHTDKSLLELGIKPEIPGPTPSTFTAEPGPNLGPLISLMIELFPYPKDRLIQALKVC